MNNPIDYANSKGLSVPRVSTRLTARDRLVHALARSGIRRGRWRVSPGLYAAGSPGSGSPVLVTANYRLSFDGLRRELGELDVWILVLDTLGINVWCAAGKGTFGTAELVGRIDKVGLKEVVSHRRLILAQLGAAGVSAHDVREKSGFRVDYGPVRALDLPLYLREGKAGGEKRRVSFRLKERLVLVPVELNHLLIPSLLMGAAAWLLGGPWAAVGLAAAVLAGSILLPVFLPWIPVRDFSLKGYILGGLAALPFSMVFVGGQAALLTPAPLRFGAALGLLLCLSTVTAFLALNFTGSTPFTSKSAVRREMRTYIPVMAWMMGIGLVLLILRRVT